MARQREAIQRKLRTIEEQKVDTEHQKETLKNQINALEKGLYTKLLSYFRVFSKNWILFSFNIMSPRYSIPGFTLPRLFFGWNEFQNFNVLVIRKTFRAKRNIVNAKNLSKLFFFKHFYQNLTAARNNKKLIGKR